MSKIARYGVKEVVKTHDEIDEHVEQLRLLGYTTLNSGLSAKEIDNLSDRFAEAEKRYRTQAEASGHDLASLNEIDIIRALPAIASEFMATVFSIPLTKLLFRTLGDYFILSQANGLINRAGSHYHQSAYHRDLPYQHFVSSRPLAINAFFALDNFTLDNGAPRVLPGSHKQEALPSDPTIENIETPVLASRGTFVILDGMTYHAGGVNKSARERRAVNLLFSMPMFRQQIHLPSLIGKDIELNDHQRRVLGFGLEEFRSIDARLDMRRSGA